MVQITISEAEKSRVTGSNPAFSVIFFFYLFISLLLFVSISFHLFIIIIIIFFLYAFLIMIFPLLVSGVQVGSLCWVGQEPAVHAAVG